MVKYECLMCLEEHDSEKVETIFCRKGFVSSCKEEGKKWPQCLICREFIDENGRNIDEEFDDFVKGLNGCCGCYRLSSLIVILLSFVVLLAGLIWSTTVMEVIAVVFLFVNMLILGMLYLILPCTYGFKAHVLKGRLPVHNRLWRKFLLSRKRPSFENVPV